MERIVVGVDGSEGSHRALHWALAESKLRGAEVVAVMAYHEPYTGSSPLMGLLVNPAEAEGEARAELEAETREELARVVAEAGGEDFPNPVRTELVQGTAAKVLVDWAQTADLVVLGTRGHGGFMGLRLGSVSYQVSHHAPCPVVLVPEDAIKA